MEHICFVVNKYPNKYEPYMLIFLQQLAWKMADMGKKVTVICPLPININFHYKNLPFHTEEMTDKNAKVDVYWPKTVGFGQSHYIFGKSPVSLTAYFMERAAMNVVKKLKLTPDVFYGHFLAPSGIVASRLGRNFGVPAFFAFGEAHDTINQFGIKQARKELESISGVIAVSSYLKNKLIEKDIVDESKIKVFPNGINGDRFYQRDKYTSRKMFNLPNEVILAGFVGAFNERKGVLRVCEAIENLNGVKLICAGKGNQEPIGKNCIFKKSLKPEQIPFFNSAADFFVLPTLNEGCSNAIVEAMACGLPIISSNRPFNDDILDDQCSIRIDPENISEIRNAIQDLVYNRKKREMMSEAAKRKASEFTLDKRAKNIISFIEEKSKEYQCENKDRNRRKNF